MSTTVFMWMYDCWTYYESLNLESSQFLILSKKANKLSCSNGIKLDFKMELISLFKKYLSYCMLLCSLSLLRSKLHFSYFELLWLSFNLLAAVGCHVWNTSQLCDFTRLLRRPITWITFSDRFSFHFSPNITFEGQQHPPPPAHPHTRVTVRCLYKISKIRGPCGGSRHGHFNHQEEGERGQENTVDCQSVRVKEVGTTEGLHYDISEGVKERKKWNSKEQKYLS